MQAELDEADRPFGMRPSEIEMLRQLVHDFDCRRILEIGMAHASSTVMLLRALQDAGGGEVVSIDPFQYDGVTGRGEVYDVHGAGMENVNASGLASMHRLINDYDYIAMPQLVVNNEKFDMIFIDGYHSFDYTFIDFFYADILLKDHGICVFHDTGHPAVNKVVQFVLRNKAYRMIGPPPLVYTPGLPGRIARRVWTVVSLRTRQMRERRTRWHSLAAVQKLETALCPQLTLSNF